MTEKKKLEAFNLTPTPKQMKTLNIAPKKAGYKFCKKKKKNNLDGCGPLLPINVLSFLILLLLIPLVAEDGIFTPKV